MRAAVDTALDYTVVGSLSSVGYHVRSRLWGWQPAAGGDLAGRVVVVTGATSGLGQRTAELLAARGADVVVHGRSASKVTAVVEGITARGGRARGEVADLTSLAGSAALADRLAGAHPQVHALVNNAGALYRERTVTAEGVEATVAVMVLSPFLLVRRLAGQLGRVVTVASGGLYGQSLRTDGLDAAAEGYRGAAAYARCKRAQLALSHQWQQRLGVPARAVDPGWVDTPGLVESLPGFHRVMRRALRTPDQGADTVVWLVAADPLPGSAHGLWRDRRPRAEHLLPTTRYPAAEEDRLWQWCEQRVR